MNSDPSQSLTFQSSGVLRSCMIKKGLPFGSPPGTLVSLQSLVYGPPNAPPPPWTNGKQYGANKPSECLTFGTPMQQHGNPATLPYGVFVPASVFDMSSNAVVLGKSYAFAIQMFPLIQMYFVVSGVAGGSIVEPGFGIYGLPEHRQGYTYITAQNFTGEWQVGLLSTLCISVMWLSVEYAPPKAYQSSVLESRLTFTIEGASDYSAFGQAGQVEPAPDFDLDKHHNFIHKTTSPYRIVTTA